MRLPFYNIKPDIKTISLSINGMERTNKIDHFKDMVNVLGEDGTTRPSRRHAMLWDSSPDQILTVDQRLFFRYGNSIKEVDMTDDGSLKFVGSDYLLKDYQNPPDRHLIWWNKSLCVLPDSISFGEDEIWNTFGADCSVTARLPFVNERSLFYTSGFSGEEVCDDYGELTVGIKLKFHWLEDGEFTVVSREEGFSVVGDGSNISEGVLITLDRPVSGYDALPAVAEVSFCKPRVKQLLPSLHIGYNGTLRLTSHVISYNLNYNNLLYNYGFRDFLRAGQKVAIKGASPDNKELIATVESVYNDSARFDVEFAPLTLPEKSEIIITPLIPQFDFALFTEDRLFGVSNAERRIYISRLRNPFVFYDESTEESDSWSMQLNDWVTGITLWKDNIICFTENGGFRVLGYTALNFGLRQLSVSGIKRGCSNSLTRIGDTLYYCSERGIMKYSGGSDRKISKKLPKITHAECSTTDGKYLYVLGDNRIWVYSPDTDLWWSEDADGISAINFYGGHRYMLSETAAYLAGGGKAQVEWSLATNMITDDTQIQPLFVKLAAEGDGVEIEFYLRFYGEEPILCKRCLLSGEQLIALNIKGRTTHGFSVCIKGKGATKLNDLKIGYRRIKR